MTRPGRTDPDRPDAPRSETGRPRRQPRPAGPDREVAADEAGPRRGGSVHPAGATPDAASPTTTPHAVLNRASPPESHDADGVARAEAEARTTPTETGPEPNGREAGAHDAATRGSDDRPRRALIYGLVALAAIVVALLIWAP